MFYAGNIVKIKRKGDLFDKVAIVDGSYATINHSRCSRLESRHYHEYSLLHFDGNASAWYKEGELELASNGSVKLITAWCERYKFGYDTVDKMISIGDIIQNKNTLEYYIVIDIINDNFITISISNFDINDKKYHSFLTNKYDVIQDMYYYKYIMSVDIPEEPVYDILSTTLNYSWGL